MNKTGIDKAFFYHVVLFSLGAAIAHRAGKDVVSVFLSPDNNGMGDFGIEGIQQGGDDQPERGTLLLDQRTRQKVGPVAVSLADQIPSSCCLSWSSANISSAVPSWTFLPSSKT